MQKITGKRVQELYEDSKNKYAYTSERFSFIANALTKDCEISVLEDLHCLCESQLKKLRENGL